MNEKLSFPLIFFYIGLLLYFFQTQINFYLSENLKFFELYSILIFLLLLLLLNIKRINIKNIYIFFIIILIIVYSNIILFLKYNNLIEQINFYNLNDFKLWRFFSVYNFLSILFCFGSQLEVMLATCFGPRRPKRPPRRFQDASKTVQDASKNA